LDFARQFSGDFGELLMYVYSEWSKWTYGSIDVNLKTTVKGKREKKSCYSTKCGTLWKVLM